MTTALAEPLFQDNPYLEGVLSFDKRGREKGIFGLLRKAREVRSMGFDRAYSIHKSYRTALLLAFARIPLRIGFAESALSFLYHKRIARPRASHEVLRSLSILGPEATVSIMESFGELQLTAEPLDSLSKELQGRISLVSEKGYAVLVPGSVWATKRWTVAGYTRLARLIKERLQLDVVIGGAPNEVSMGDLVAEGSGALNLTGKTSLKEFLTLIAHAKLVVCNDSMALHVASAFKIPTVAIFCATSPSFGFGPWRNRGVVVERADLSCKPCSPHGGPTCPTGTEACMRGVEVETVFKAAKEVLQYL